VARPAPRGYSRGMSEDAREPKDSKSDAGAAPVTTPFEKPFFMPVLLFLLALWFGYDGWFNEEIKSIMFNRVVFCGLVILAIYTTYQDVREVRKSKEIEKGV
jgi:hypothetical protein